MDGRHRWGVHGEKCVCWGMGGFRAGPACMRCAAHNVSSHPADCPGRVGLTISTARAAKAPRCALGSIPYDTECSPIPGPCASLRCAAAAGRLPLMGAVHAQRGPGACRRPCPTTVLCMHPMNDCFHGPVCGAEAQPHNTANFLLLQRRALGRPTGQTAPCATRPCCLGSSLCGHVVLCA